MMDLDTFRTAIEQVAPLTEQVTFHLMGEPLVHPRLEEMIEICSSNHMPIFFVSNGVLLKEKRADLLLHPIIRQVNFSLHSFHDNYPDRDPTIYLENIFTFTERAFVERPDLYVNYRLWNLQETRGAGEHNTSMLKRIADRFQVELDTEVNVVAQKSKRVKNKLYLHYDTEFIWPSPDLPIIGENGTCKGLDHHFGILADGTVVPCCLDKEGNIPLGNIRETPVADILGSPRAAAILKGFRQRKLKEDLCQRCQYVTRFGG